MKKESVGYETRSAVESESDSGMRTSRNHFLSSYTCTLNIYADIKVENSSSTKLIANSVGRTNAHWRTLKSPYTNRRRDVFNILNYANGLNREILNIFYCATL